MSKYRAKKAHCSQGHTHDSIRESRRCNDLHVLQKAGQISGLEIHPKFRFSINGADVKLDNGHVAGYTADFSYIENNREIVEDVKGFIVRDFPLRAAIFRTLYPGIELRVTK